jgi:hypothetical protein
LAIWTWNFIIRAFKANLWKACLFTLAPMVICRISKWFFWKISENIKKLLNYHLYLLNYSSCAEDHLLNGYVHNQHWKVETVIQWSNPLIVSQLFFKILT